MADEKSIDELCTFGDNRLPEIHHNLIHVPSSEYKCIFSDEDLKKAEEWRLEFERFSNVIFVDNLPEVPKENVNRLEWLVRNMYSHFGVIKDDGFWMPIDVNTQITLGYCYIKYNPYTPQVNREHPLPEEKARDLFKRNISIQLKPETGYLWRRPMAPSPFIVEKEEEIAKNKYEVEEQDVSIELSEQDCEKRKTSKVEWNKWVDLNYLYKAEKLLRGA